MGSNGSKQTKEKKIPKSDPEYELSQKTHQHDQIRNPSNDRPIKLSWLQQNNINDNYNREHNHHDERLRRIPLAINRWPKQNDDENPEQNSKTFIEKYVHQ